MDGFVNVCPGVGERLPPQAWSATAAARAPAKPAERRIRMKIFLIDKDGCVAYSVSTGRVSIGW